MNIISALAGGVLPSTELLLLLGYVLNILDIYLDGGRLLGRLLLGNAQGLCLIVFDCIGEHVLDLLVSSLPRQAGLVYDGHVVAHIVHSVLLLGDMIENLAAKVHLELVLCLGKVKDISQHLPHICLVNSEDLELDPVNDLLNHIRGDLVIEGLKFGQNLNSSVIPLGQLAEDLAGELGWLQTLLEDKIRKLWHFEEDGSQGDQVEQQKLQLQVLTRL